MRVITELQKTIDYYKIKAKEAHRRAEKFKKLKNEPNQGYAKLLERERISNTEARNHEQLASWLTELQERREADRWISVTERLPEKAGEYLCTLHYAIPPYHMFHPEKDIYVDDVRVNRFDGTAFVSSVTHWRPLPPKPYESEDPYKRAKDECIPIGVE